MGDCYAVHLRAKLKDEKAACDALRALIKRKGNDGRADFSLDKYAEQGITPDTFDGLMKIFFAGWEGQRVEIERHEDGFTTYANGFNASYGWGCVLLDMFEILTPFLADGSEFYVDADETKIDCEIVDGKVVDMTERCEMYCHNCRWYNGYKIGQRGNGAWEVWDGATIVADGFDELEQAQDWVDEEG